MRIMVTGATGRLGSRTTRALLRRGHNVLALESPRSATGLVGAIAVDLADADALTSAARQFRPEGIVHLGAIVGAACERNADLTQAVNVDATRALAEAAAASGTSRFVLSSTAAVYGDAYTRPVLEGDELRGHGAYASSKRQAEDVLINALDSESAMSGIALRIFNIFGPTFSNSLVARLARSTAESPVELTGIDAFVRDYVHVDDVVDAILLSLGISEPGAHIVNIGSGVPTSTGQLLADLSPDHSPYYTVVGDTHSYSCADISLARDLLGYAPTRGVTAPDLEPRDVHSPPPMKSDITE